tara:strand:+ start:487 stop:1329 length:843 start_codon:yes stop_codon:yes gene_type:complete
MKRKLFSCNYCDIEKFNSESQEYENIPFYCETLAHWKQHISRVKHCINIERNKNLEDDLVVECKHCDGVYTKEQYKKHKDINQLLWASKGFSYTKDCSCNNFCYGKKRFETLQELREYVNIKEKYSYGKDKKINYTKKEYDKALEILNDRQEHENKLQQIRQQNENKMRKELEEKKVKEQEQEQEKNRKKNLVKPIKENIQLTIEDEFNTLNGIEEKVNPKTDLNEPPEFCDFCGDCGKPDNSISEYSIEKLERYDIDICDCESDEDSDSDSDSDQEKII